jgi:hypothetical protein
MVDKDDWPLYGSQNQAASGGHWPGGAGGGSTECQ